MLPQEALDDEADRVSMLQTQNQKPKGAGFGGHFSDPQKSSEHADGKQRLTVIAQDLKQLVDDLNENKFAYTEEGSVSAFNWREEEV